MSTSPNYLSNTSYVYAVGIQQWTKILESLQSKGRNKLKDKIIALNCDKCYEGREGIEWAVGVGVPFYQEVREDLLLKEWHVTMEELSDPPMLVGWVNAPYPRGGSDSKMSSQGRRWRALMMIHSGPTTSLPEGQSARSRSSLPLSVLNVLIRYLVP